MKVKLVSKTLKQKVASLKFKRTIPTSCIVDHPIFFICKFYVQAFLYCKDILKHKIGSLPYSECEAVDSLVFVCTIPTDRLTLNLLMQIEIYQTTGNFQVFWNAEAKFLFEVRKTAKSFL